jgi:Tol biopolymer transport system component/DNA-binding winged helix-turn-helix (wHTH) protein
MHGGWIQAGADLNSRPAKLYPQTIERNVVINLSELVTASEASVILSCIRGAFVGSSASSPDTVRFGMFEADLATGELRKRGRKVALQDQPFQILALLLQRPGEIVSREDLQRALWPADTFVEFEHGVNTAMKKLRQALGDSADNPRFIETLPRKGYRFIAPVAGLAMPDQGPVAAPVTAPAARRRGWWWLASLGLFAVVAGFTVWLLSRPGKATATIPVPVPLTAYPGLEIAPSFSPEGDRVAFSWNGPNRGDNFDIYVKLIGADVPVRLTQDPGPDVNPAWSPNGRWIAFLRGWSYERNGVYLIPAVGGPERKLTELFAGEPGFWEQRRISWHPGGQWLVVPDRTSAQEPMALFLVSFETGEKRRLTSPPGKHFGDAYPAVSPDGRTVAFTRIFSEEGRDLYLQELSEGLRPVGEPRRITFWQRCTTEPAWWPDGNSILFASGASHSNKALWQMAIRGPGRQPGEPERLPFGGDSYFLTPAISRQGRVVYMQTALAAHIWRLELGGNHRAEKLPMNSSRLDHVPQYSPDGKRIAFASNRSGSHEIWVCEADGSNAVKLTSFGGPYVAVPTWSPDGRRIAFDARLDGISQIHIVSTDGGKPELLRGTQNQHGTPSWSRDGKWVYFFSNRSGKNQVWKAPAGGGDPLLVTKQGGTYGVESPDGKFVYYLRSWEGSTTELWRVPVEGGEEIRIIESVAPQFFAVVARGIYFFPGGNNPAVRCFNFATRKIETVAKVEEEIMYGLSVSPDSRWLLYTARGNEHYESDLMLVEKFR